MQISKLNMLVYVVAFLSVSLIVADVLFEETSDPNGQRTQSVKPHVDESHYIAMAKGFVDVESGVIKLAASRDGIIRQVMANEGDHVRAGQVLAMQDIQEATLAYGVAKAQLQELTAGLKRLQVQLSGSRRERKRLRSLFTTRSVSRRELDQTDDQIKVLKTEILAQHAAIETAQARVKVSGYEIELRTIRAPVDGYVAKRLARPGEGASTLSVTPLFWFIPDGPLVIRAEVDEEFIDKIKIGMQADVVLLVDEDRQYHASVSRIGRALGPKQPTVYDPRERADVRVVECLLTLDDNASRLVLGQRVIVKIKKTEHGPLLPNNKIKE